MVPGILIAHYMVLVNFFSLLMVKTLHQDEMLNVRTDSVSDSILLLIVLSGIKTFLLCSGNMHCLACL